MKQAIFTFTARVHPERVSALQAYLDSIGATPQSLRAAFPFKALTKLHFASIFIVGAADNFPAYLVFENNIDGTIPAYIEQICNVAATALHTMFSNCCDYTSPEFSLGDMRRFLAAHVLLPSTSYVGNVGRDVGRIRAEACLAKRLERFTDAAPRELAARDLYRFLRARTTAVAGWALRPKERLPAAEISRRWLMNQTFMIGTSVCVLLWAGVCVWLSRSIRFTPPFAQRLVKLPRVVVAIAFFLSPFALFVTVLRIDEVTDGSHPREVDATETIQYLANENRGVQNHFASVSTVKPGLFRRLTLRSVLIAVNRVARTSLDGTLAGLDNIHFAHWVVIDGGRRLVFLTNYDGSWENYLDDFIDKMKARMGLTAIWSNVRNFPKTWFLGFGGASNERKFKASARQSEIKAPVWYSAYPSLSVAAIENNSATRDGLASKPATDADLENWLQLL